MTTGYWLGLFLAAQVGPVTLLIVRSVLRGGRVLAVGIAMAGAVTLIDLLYATLGLAGIGQLLDGGVVQPVLGLVSAAILITIGARTAWAGFRARSGLESAEEIVAPRQAFLTAVAATALNPLTIALWTVSFPAAAPASAGSSVARAASLLVGVALGTMTWYCGFAAAVAVAGKRTGDRFVRLVDIGSGCCLIAFGSVLGYRSVHDR
jgi:threonine/homoserine/homoserine lactone efflux protein